MTLGIIDILIIVAFIAYAIGSGLRSRSLASRNLEEYFLAGRSLSGWQAGISMAATQFAADTPLNVVGIIAIAGIFALWQLWIYALAFLLMGFVLAACWRNAGVLTDAELTEFRYGGRPAAALRGFKAIYFGTIFNCIVLGWVFFAGAKIAEPFLLWDQWLPTGLYSVLVNFFESLGFKFTSSDLADPNVWIQSTNNFLSIIAIITVTTLYSTTGGLRSVVATDIVQFGIMIVATIVFAAIVISHVGGIGALQSRIYEVFADGAPGPITPEQILAFTPSNAKDASLGILVLFGLQWLIQLNADGTGYLAQRTMACKSSKDAKVAALVFTMLQILVRTWMWLPIGLGLLLLYSPDPAFFGKALAGNDLEAYRLERELTYVQAIADHLPMGVKGLMLTAMLAALASTVDTHLNWGASYWTNDIYKRFICQGLLKQEPADRSLVWVARIATLSIVLVSLGVMTQLKSINQTWQISLLLGAGMGLPLVLRWIWWRMNAWAEIAAILVSMVVALAFVSNKELVADHASRLLVLALLSTIASCLAIYLVGPESHDRLRAFYTRVKPPGFWGPIAMACGESPTVPQKRLFNGLLAMVLTALSVFCLLVAVGSALVGSPPPVWFPLSPLAWILAIGLLGLALIPAWIKVGFNR